MLYSHRLIILHKGLPYRKDLQLVGQAMIQHGRRIVEFEFGARVGVATQDRVFPYYASNSSIKHSKSDSKDRFQEIL
jgi:hypothetical protein